MKKEIIRKIYLLSKRQPMKPIEVVQYETGVQLVFEVQDIELDNSATVTLFVRKPSGKFVFQEDNISLTGNTVVIDLHNQAITEYGNPFFQIKFKNGEEIISTYSGMLTVEKSLEDSGAEESKTVIAAFGELTDEQISRIEEATRVQIDLMKAEVEAKGETVLATIPEDYTEMYNRVNTLANSVANAIKGTVSGSVVRVDDVSPVEHKPVVMVHGKNLLQPDKLVVRPDYADLYSSALSVFDYCVEESKTYTISFDTENTGKLMYLNPNSGFDYTQFRMDGKRHSFTKKMTKTIRNSVHQLTLVSVAETSNVACGSISNVQLEEGDTATEYTPYIDPTTVTVKRCGKNILKPTITDRTASGLDFTVDEDGRITVNGTATATTFAPIGSVNLKAGNTYMLSGCASGGSVSSYRLDLRNTNTLLYEPNVFDYGNGVLFTPEEDATLVVGLRYANEAVISNVKFSPMIQVANDTDLQFETYNGEEHTPSSDGIVEGIASLSPVMTLLTDKEGVTIECEYIKDTNKVINNLAKAVVALGGAV